jgi:hypothetical protein
VCSSVSNPRRHHVSYKDRQLKADIPPTGLEQVHTEYESLLWVIERIRYLDRFPSCKRKETLKLILTEMLDKENLKSKEEQLAALRQQLSILKQENESLVIKLNDSVGQLEKAEHPEPVVVRLPSEPKIVIQTKEVLVHTGFGWKSFIFWMILATCIGVYLGFRLVTMEPT